MKKVILGCLATALMASGANAAVTLTNVTVNGLKTDGTPSGTVWDTTNNSYYAVFVSPSGGAALNPNDQPINAPIVFGEDIFNLAGEHWALENVYKLTATLSNGVVLTEIFNRSNDTVFASSSAVAGGYRYSLDGFYWRNSFLDSVKGFQYAPTGDKIKADFGGQFAVIQAAIPEPATWAMMLAGFGLMGVGLRGRRSRSETPVLS